MSTALKLSPKMPTFKILPTKFFRILCCRYYLLQFLFLFFNEWKNQWIRVRQIVLGSKRCKVRWKKMINQLSIHSVKFFLFSLKLRTEKLYNYRRHIYFYLISTHMFSFHLCSITKNRVHKSAKAQKSCAVFKLQKQQTLMKRVGT